MTRAPVLKFEKVSSAGRSRLNQSIMYLYSRPSTGLSHAGYLFLSILLHVLPVEIDVAFAQLVVAHAVFVVNFDLESDVLNLIIHEVGERLIEDDVFAASLQRSHSSSARYSTTHYVQNFLLLFPRPHIIFD